jgi:hypothetical protein
MFLSLPISVRNWKARIQGYLNREFNPNQATGARLGYVALHKGIIVGFIAGPSD